MQVRSVSWPTRGDRATFQRRRFAMLGAGSAVLALALGAAWLANPELLRPLLPLAASAMLLLFMWTHAAARTMARRAELEQSFAGLAVVHLGERYQVADERCLLGEFTTRRHAARAAIDRGDWALIVQAWDRYYLLAATPAARLTRDAAAPAPVSFRSRAVADVVPAIRDAAIA
ncbi:MAG: hypothetical protein JWM86_1774 [Thermoleophilia bacterium]|nr:hypothetical protein [Thermoleophilia bacterium]